jgi:hypothetical protein
MTHPLGDTTEDAERWWRAYQLAENDQAGELRNRAAAGDEHARRQLASWLADRARTEEAIEVIRPLADAGDEVAGLWLARWLADGDHLDELHQRAASGSYPALHELAEWLAGREHLDELRELVAGHRELLAGWLAREHGMRVARLQAEFGDDQARRRLQVWLACCASAPMLATSTPGDSWPRIRTGGNSWPSRRADQAGAGLPGAHPGRAGEMLVVAGARVSVGLDLGYRVMITSCRERERPVYE